MGEKMKKQIQIACFMASMVLLSCAKPEKNVELMTLWYKQPAANWVDALPVGNGRLGAMVFGNVYRERIQLNEESLWAGKRQNTNNPNAQRDLPEIRRLIFDENIKEAYDLGNKSLLGVPPRVRSHQTLGDLFILMDSSAVATDYRRDLNLNNGISTTRFKLNGVTYSRDVFVSAPDNALVVHISTDRPGALDATIGLERKQDATTRANRNTLLMQGQIMDETNQKQGEGGAHMKFAAKLVALHRDGEIVAQDSVLNVQGASEITLLLTAATDYNLDLLNFDRSIDPKSRVEGILEQAQTLSAGALKKRHVDDHRALFDRVSMDLGRNSLALLPTDARLDSVIAGREDPALVALYFQYGRYLLMGSSRAPGQLPANLQGIWNEHFNAPWNADYHTNINLQMNYWHAEIANLPETVLPLTSIIDKWREPGRETAREMYNCDGWAMHHNTDIFGVTSPRADMRWGMSPLSGVWMTFPLWRHYEFTRDLDYLRDRAYPIMREAMVFVSDFLVEKDGYLVTNPTMSPENAFKLPGKNYPAQLTWAATIDNQTLMAHIDNCIRASEILGIDEAERGAWKKIREKIPPVQIGKDGTIMEWIKDYEEWEPGHRHMSHLLGLHPLAQITPETPALFAAASETIKKRLANGGGHTGWSRAWIINFFARLHDSEKAHENVLAILRKSTLHNLFDSHPPFQIDGNFGAAAGIAEMLLQSHNGVIQLLPALPEAWPDGAARGLRARGGFTLDFSWAGMKLSKVTITSTRGIAGQLKYGDKTIEIPGATPGEIFTFDQWQN